MPTISNLSDRRFGRLVALDYESVPVGQSGRLMVRWRCQCDCGKEKTVLACHLTAEKIQSCGCLSAEKAAERFRQMPARFRRHKLTHGLSRAPEYSVWSEMIRRCHNQGSSRFNYYGARGIRVCNRWRYGENGKSGFECFIEDMGRRERRGLSIERTNNDGNYEPSNCKWATQTEQMNNTRRTRR